MRRRVFYSFHYAADSWRAAMVRNIGVVEGSRPATDNEWEDVARGGDAAIKKWIGRQMKGRSCTLVLVGTNTAGRRWIKYEIKKSWNDGMGVAGIHIHGLRDSNRVTSRKGTNPFWDMNLQDRDGYIEDLASVAKCYDPPGQNSEERYAWIRNNLASIVEEALLIRKENQ